MLREIGRRRFLVPVPFAIAHLQALAMEIADRATLQILPPPPLTRDQVRLLERDNVVSAGALTLADLGIQPSAVELMVPSYLARYRPGGRFVRPARS